MQTFMISNKTVSVFTSFKPETPIIYLNPFSGEGQKIYEAAQAAGCPPFTLVAVSDLDWNHDMAPWDSPPTFKNADLCTGGADDYLRLLTEEIIPAAEKDLGGVPRWRGIAGYSLAGLFALYALYQTDVFARAASMSGSFWFEGIMEYVCSHEMKRKPDCLYFSLGDKESSTDNPILNVVQQNTQEIETLCHGKGIETTFVLNSGSHYQACNKRTAAGIHWILNR